MKTAKNPCQGSLLWRLNQLTRQLQAQLETSLAAIGLDGRGYVAMLRLSATPCGNQLQLARESDIDKSTLVAVLDRLEGKGWVARAPDPTDRRSRVVRLTDAGMRKLAEAREAATTCEARFLEPLEEPMRAVLTAAVARLSVADPVGPATPMA